MKELLFDSLIEKEALENILALNQIRKCDAEIEKYTEEIKEQNEEMMKILKDEDIDEGYVEKIHKYKNLLTNMDGDSGRINELEQTIEENENRINEFQEKIKEIEERLEELNKEIFETNDPSKVIECQNEIENNNVRLNDLNDILNGLISDNTPLLIEKEYLAAKNSDFDFNVPSYNKKEISADLESITSEFNAAIEKLDLPVRENIEFCQKKIRNREIEIEKFNERKNQVIEAYPNSITFDLDGAYNDIANLLEELELNHGCICVPEKNIFDEEDTTEDEIETPVIEEKEEVVEEPKEIKDEMVLLDESEEVEEPVAVEEEIETPVVEEKEEVVVEEPKELKDEMVLLENEETEEEIVEEPIAEEKVVEEPAVVEETTAEEASVEEESTDNDEIGSVSYVLSDGESLVNIAEKVYPSKDNWEAIYYFNKETIDKYLVSNGISNDFDTIKELASDTSLFTGIKLEIPTDYNYKI